MATSLKRRFGDSGEERAVEYLIKNGYLIIERNYRIKNLGEIDIVSKKGGQLIFIEVKTRNVEHERNFPIGFSIDAKKRVNLRRICELYLIDKSYPHTTKWRVDAILIKVDREKDLYIFEYLENILWERYY